MWLRVCALELQDLGSNSSSSCVTSSKVLDLSGALFPHPLNGSNNSRSPAGYGNVTDVTVVDGSEEGLAHKGLIL